MVEVDNGLKSIEIGGETFWVEHADSYLGFTDFDEYYTEVGDFYHDYWGTHIPYNPAGRFAGGNAGDRLNSLTNLTCIRNSENRIVALGGQLPQENENGELGLFIVHPDYRRKGLAKVLADYQLDSIEDSHPDNESVPVEAVTLEGLRFAHRLKDDVSERTKLTISVCNSVVREIVIEAFGLALDKLDLEKEYDFLSWVDDLISQKRVEFDLGEDLESFLENSHSFGDVLEFDDHYKVHQAQVKELISFIGQRLSVGDLIDLSEAEDSDQILECLETIGITVNLD